MAVTISNSETGSSVRTKLNNSFGMRGPRLQSVTSAATVTPTINTVDQVIVSAQAEALEIANPSGTPENGQALLIHVKDDGTPRAITWGAIYQAMDESLPTTTIAGKLMVFGFQYSTLLTKWIFYGSKTQA
jgi:hypothetical protein